MPELLAPAGDEAAFRAALEAGADAVYLGLGELDARRGAPGIEVARLPELVAAAHAKGARVHLTLNVLLAARELGRAARSLAWAARSGVDAVLVADPALLVLAPCFPGVQIHLSTQAGVGSSAGVRAAAALGAARVVLARELGLDEIAPCLGHGPEVEVFAQGALCFAVSGRCSMTSWVGGRSGNRGTCTSICRVNWRCGGGAPARPLDMKDLSAVRQLPRLAALGVHSLKIEGRLKSPEWVARAVGLFRRALAGGADAAELWREAEALGAYSGREMTDGYLSGERVGLVHPDEGRAAGADPVGCGGDQDAPRRLAVAVARGARGWEFTLSCSGRSEQFSIPASVAHAGRAVEAGGLRERLRELLPEGVELEGIAAPADLLLPRRVANDVAARIVLWARPRSDGVDRLKVVLPDAVRAALDPGRPHPGNRLGLDAAPGCARLDLDAVPAFAAALPAVAVVAEVRDAAGVERLHACAAGRATAALPPVLYEADLPAAAAACAAAAARGMPVEVNGWDGWWLARQAGAEIEAGPGLAVLNPLAAAALARQGVRAVHALPEADAGKLADLCAGSPLPLTIGVFGRPALMHTRAWRKAPGWEMEDGRGSIRIRPRQEGPVVALRPAAPFDWRGARAPGVRAARLEMDLCASPDPVAEWRSRPDARAHRYNLERELA